MPIARRLLPFVAVALFCSAAASRAHADPPAAISPEAEALFRQGRAAATAGDHATACAKFAESLAIERATGTVFNLAHCEDKLDKVASALEHYTEAIGRMKEGERRLAFARERAAALEPRAPRLTIRVPEPLPAGLRVFRGAEEIAPALLGRTILVDPGAHRIRVVADGRDERVIEIVLGEARNEVLLAEPGPETVPVVAAVVVPPPAAAAAPPRPVMRQRDHAHEPSVRRTAGWVVLGSGAAGLAFGLLAGGIVLREKGTFDDRCGGKARCADEEGVDAADRGVAWATASNVAFVAGAVAVVTGVVLVLSAPSQVRAKSIVSARPDLTPVLGW